MLATVVLTLGVLISMLIATAVEPSPSQPLPVYLQNAGFEAMYAYLGSKEADERLPDHQTPLNYSLDLSVNVRGYNGATVSDFNGTVKIELINNLDRAKTIKLNSHLLLIRKVTLVSHTFDRLINVSYQQPENYVLTLNLSEKLKQHETLLLTIEYSGVARPEINEGIYESLSPTGQVTVVTMGETHHNRRWLPCFDQPNFKAPLTLSITHPSQLKALANMLETSTILHSARTATTHFPPTPPISSYLYVFAIINASSCAERNFNDTNGISIMARVCDSDNILSQSDLDEKVAMAAKLLAKLSNRYSPAPLIVKKYDFLLLSSFPAGAMENPGLITVERNTFIEDVIAHEICHQWFGNLVTMRWWSDIWLNEGFATWCEKDDYQSTSVKRYKERFESSPPLHDGSLITFAEAYQAIFSFDGITYVKGANVVAMVHSLIGADNFDRAIKNYLHRHAYGSVDSMDIIDAWAEKAPMNADDFRDIALSFIDQPGTPLLVVTQISPQTFRIRQEPLWKQHHGFQNMKYSIPIYYGYDMNEKLRTNVTIFWRNQSYIDIHLPDEFRNFKLNPAYTQRGFYDVEPSAYDGLVVVSNKISHKDSLTPFASRGLMKKHPTHFRDRSQTAETEEPASIQPQKLVDKGKQSGILRTLRNAKQIPSWLTQFFGPITFEGRFTPPIVNYTKPEKIESTKEEVGLFLVENFSALPPNMSHLLFPMINHAFKYDPYEFIIEMINIDHLRRFGRENPIAAAPFHRTIAVQLEDDFYQNAK